MGKRIFRGHLDKHGNKIYLGDYVKCNPDKVKVKYTDGTEKMELPETKAEIGEIFEVKHDELTGGLFPFSDYDCDCGLYNWSKDFEIVGNNKQTPDIEEIK